MKFDPLIIATDGVRFRLCRCQKILEKYNKRPFNILKESSYSDGQIFFSSANLKVRHLKSSGHFFPHEPGLYQMNERVGAQKLVGVKQTNQKE